MFKFRVGPQIFFLYCCHVLELLTHKNKGVKGINHFKNALQNHMLNILRYMMFDLLLS